MHAATNASAFATECKPLHTWVPKKQTATDSPLTAAHRTGHKGQHKRVLVAKHRRARHHTLHKSCAAQRLIRT
jgi:hypothetical protein